MSRRSSRSSRSTQLYSTIKPASADLSLVFADPIQVGTSPGVAAATLPRQSVPEASSSLFERATLERATKDTASSFAPRSTHSLLSNMYFSKRRQHPTAIPRTERVIQTETWSSAEIPRVPPLSDHGFNSAQVTFTPKSLRFAIPDSHLNAGLPPDPTTSPAFPEAFKLDAKLEKSMTLGLSLGTNTIEPISSTMCLQDAEGSYLVSTHSGSDYLECPNISITDTVEPEQMNIDPTDLEMTSGAFSRHGVLQQADNCPDRMHGNQILSDSGENSPLVDPVIKSDSHSGNSFSKFPLYLPSSLLPKQFFSSGSKEEVKYIEDHLKNSTTQNMTSVHNDQLNPAIQIHSEGSQDDILTETSPIAESSSLPSSTWSDYLRFTTTTIPKLRPSFSDPMAPPESPPSKEYFGPCNIQVTLHPTQATDISNRSWFAPWTWWHVNTGLSSNTESVAVPINPEGDFKGSHTGPIGTKSLFTKLANPIDADRETRVGWLSVLTTTYARQRALKEEGETMEVATVAEGLSGIKPSTSEAINIQPESRPNVSILKSAPPKDSTLLLSSKKSTTPYPSNLVLPTFEDAFCNPPRSTPLPREESTLHRTVNYVAKMLFRGDATAKGKGKGKEKEPLGQELPKAWSVLGEDPKKVLEKVKRVVVIGIHGWFPRAFVRQVLGEPTGTSEKFAMMLERTVKEFFDEYGVTLDKITKIVLQGEGTVAQRVNKWVLVFSSKTFVGERQSADVTYSLFQEYLSHEDWVNDLQTADAILFGTHSQGSIVTTQLVDRLINEGHIRTPNSSLLSPVSATQRVGVLALCGVHNGPLLYLNTSSFVNPYIQYFESAAAQNRLLLRLMSDYLCDSTHPLILRALYIDGDAYHSSDFLSNLLVLLFKIRNAGLHDNGLIAHLSEATAGSLTGLGHSTAYEEPASYKFVEFFFIVLYHCYYTDPDARLAVRFLFETSDLIGSDLDLVIEPFTARAARNDYEIPWVLRDLIANPDVAALFASDFSGLRSAFDDWHPRTTVLRDIRRKLEPIRRLNTSKL
ncbi:hypothetical protein Clacol_008226 [Clathrus columnatus]|uniref:YMC020W-like alpha/beta hydrolase domain-containing protein n=1 Tax=Clathrus columnatus TaxID=1419009 RepID=A0AAV5ALF9_9AGAM|nr:hypothetical protein Clacol_008226 [Clathrus columnatus]